MQAEERRKMELKSELRTQVGKIAVKKLRKDNKIPAVIYRGKTKPIYIQLEEKTIKSIHEGEHITIDCGEKYDALIKEIQLNPVSLRIVHIDFQELKAKEKIRLKIPVVIEGEETVVKQGLIVERGVHEVEIECLPKDIPDSIKVNVSNLKDGDSIHIEDLPAENIKFITKPDAPIAMVQIPKVAKEPTPEAVAAEGTVEAETETGAKGDEKTGADEKTASEPAKGDKTNKS